jgi:hypothetical protein
MPRIRNEEMVFVLRLLATTDMQAEVFMPSGRALL